MGNCAPCSNQEFLSYEERLEKTETEVYRLTEIPLEQIIRKHVWINLGENDDDRVAIRTIIISDGTGNENWFQRLMKKQKPTLLLIHGFG